MDQTACVRAIRRATGAPRLWSSGSVLVLCVDCGAELAHADAEAAGDRADGRPSGRGFAALDPPVGPERDLGRVADGLLAHPASVAELEEGLCERGIGRQGA